MMKIRSVPFIILLILGLSSLSFGQINWQKGSPVNYEYQGVFDSTAALPHGIVVDKYNRVWIGSFSASGPGLIVQNSDGTEASFSPITQINFGAETIPLDDGNCRGMAIDIDGNILYAKASMLFNIDVETGSGITKWDGPASLTKPAVDANGNIYVGTVAGVAPIYILEPIFLSEVGQIGLNPKADLARGIEITPDGKNLWTSNLDDGGPVYQYTTEDFVTYPVSDSIWTDADGDTIFQFKITTVDWGPDSTLWFSHETEDATKQSQNSLVIFDLKTQTYSSLLMPDIPGNAFNGPRGVAFTASGDTAYVASFNGGRVVRFVKSGTVSVNENKLLVPSGFMLDQNYPNPFNPSTTISFSLSENKKISLRIYNSLGREVRILIDNQEYLQGTYDVIWDGTDNSGHPVTSGIYVYQLIFGNLSKSKTMSLIR